MQDSLASPRQDAEIVVSWNAPAAVADAGEPVSTTKGNYDWELKSEIGFVKESWGDIAFT